MPEEGSRTAPIWLSIVWSRYMIDLSLGIIIESLQSIQQQQQTRKSQHEIAVNTSQKCF